MEITTNYSKSKALQQPPKLCESSSATSSSHHHLQLHHSRHVDPSSTLSTARNTISNKHQIMWPPTKSSSASSHKDENEIERQSLSDEGDDDDNLSKNSDMSDNEIPVWVRGEQRWISGVSDVTTCYDLIEALLMDGETAVNGDGQNSGCESKPNEFVIIERWRKMEQVLEPNTKIWKIWNAWGEGQSEVRLSLHRIDSQRRNGLNAGDGGDSGRGSPTGSINSAIERRRRHRASKSTSAWLTHAQTLHPKSQKATIEKLMKLILEQGETIQQQLRKLRDKEIQISRIEEDRHKVREKEHGKNYLLETYLKGLHEADDKDHTNAHSDSGINTEDTATPEVGMQSPATLQHDDEIKDDEEASSNHDADPNDTQSQIEMLERMVSLNKKLQHEEELLLKLTVKIRRYEYESPSLTEDDIKREIDRLNDEISKRNSESAKTEQQIEVYDEVLKIKSNVLDQLIEEYEQSSSEIPPVIPPPPDDTLLYRSHTPETLLLSPPPQFQSNVTEVQIHSIPNQKLITENPKFFNNPTGLAMTPNGYPTLDLLQQNSPFVSAYSSAPDGTNLLYHHHHPTTQLIQLEKCDQRNLNCNNNYLLSSNCNSVKLAPKKFLINTNLNNNNNNNNNNANIIMTANGTSDTNSDTGLSSMGDVTDMSQLGTLV